MTNYEKLIKNITPEILADLNVKLVCLNEEKLFYVTSTGQLFPMSNHMDALQFEYKWLTSNAREDDAEGKEEPSEKE